MRPVYQALSFDGDGTLWDLESAMRAGLEEAASLLRSAGLTYRGQPVTADWLREVRDAVARHHRHRPSSMEEIRFVSFEVVTARCGRPDRNLVREVYDTYMDARWGKLAAYADVPEALRALASRYRLALITNGNTHPHRVKLDGVFGTVVLAAECGHSKPDPAIYAYAAKRMALHPAQVMHIGDDPAEDVAPAAAAGMDTVWINRDGRSWSHPDSPTYVVGDLCELDLLLCRLQDQGRVVGKSRRVVDL